MSSSLDNSVRIDPVWVSQMKEEYNIQGRKQQHALEKLNFGEQALSARNSVLLETCAKCCQILGLNQIDHTNLLLKYNDLILEKRKCDDLISSAEEHKLDCNLADLEKQNATMERDHGDACSFFKNVQEVSSDLIGKSNFFMEKKKGYEERLAQLEANFPSCNPEINFDTILEKNAQLKQMDEEIKSLKSKLAHSRKLPANMTLAREKLKQAKIDLDKLKLEVNSRIGNFINSK